MTREEKEKLIRHLRYNLEIGADYLITDKDVVEIIKALEQESIIDKLRDEIMDTGAYEQEVNGNTEFLKGINYCLGVIDKYKVDMESKEWKNI